MNRLHMIFILFLTLCVLNFFMAGTGFSQENWYATAEITKNKPVVKSLPEEKIPVETIKGKEGGGSKLLWALLGVALVGGIAAAIGGGGGSDDPDPPNPPATTGDVSISW